ncbi:MAG: winged helix-turn-helix transcriptional regulator [Tannerella sp.]|nr:winged helix-turn-helix transcriptional regulator [Tannerella sp.]
MPLKSLIKRQLKRQSKKLPKKLPKNCQKTAKKTAKNKTQITHNKIVAIIKKNQNITREAIAKELNISSNTARHHLQYLRRKGIIQYEGQKKGGKWVLLSE